jgi:hypothetical protein
VKQLGSGKILIRGTKMRAEAKALAGPGHPSRP